MLFALVPREDHARPEMLAPLAWAAAAWALDAHLLHNAPSAQPDKPASLRLEPASLGSLTFGLCGLLGAKSDSRHTHLFVYAIMGSILVVLPSHNLEPGCVEEQYFESVQKAALIWCIGLLVAGVALARPRFPPWPR